MRKVKTIPLPPSTRRKGHERTCVHFHGLLCFVPCSRSFLSLICVQRRQLLSLFAFTTFFRESFAGKDHKIMKDLWMHLLVMATTVSTAQSWAPLKGFTRTTRSLSMMGQATYNGAIAETPSHHSFPYLKSLEERVNRLSSEESDCMVTS